MPRFVHLHTHSHYSLLDGLAKIDDLVRRVKELGMDSVAITDHGVLYGAVEFYKKAKKAGVKPILGVEAYVAAGSRSDRIAGERYYHLILLAENNTGWKNMVKLVSRANLEGFYYKPRVDKELLREYHEGLIALSACLSGEVNRFLLHGKYEEAKKAALEYKDIFGEKNFFLEIGHHPHIPEVVKIWPEIIKLSEETGIKLVATQDIHYLLKEDTHYHDILVAVQTGNRLSDDDRLTLSADDFSMSSPEEMAERFKDIPEAIENTVAIADRCNTELELGKTLLPNFPKPDGIGADEFLRTLAYERIGNRFSKEEQTKEVIDRLEYELDVIKKTGFADYFLIVQDLVNWAKNHGIAVGPGRGSAAGSIVSYILNITDINPLAYGLLFERFLNPERIQMPDIDMDFADVRRDEVIAYARERYGEDHVAQIITFGTMAARAAIRDAGRALGLSYGLCDQIAKLIPFQLKLAEALKKVPELKEMYDKNPDAKKVLDAALHLEGVARHASVHAAGTVISKDPLTDHVPIQLAPQDKESIVTQFEMHAIEDIGLLKMDLLGLKNLTIIENATRLIKDTKGETVDVARVPLNDSTTFEILQEADTTGVFQLESSGMRRYLKELKPTRLEDIIAMVALYRPGPMELIPSFIARKHGTEPIEKIHPIVDKILASTYGVIVYQEQVMDMATELAGLTKGEGYLLIKAVGKKIKALLDEQKEKFIGGCLKNNIPQTIADRIWGLIEPFARYGFNKAHSACYATIAYRTAYLKAHYPTEFMASWLNAESRDIERIAFLVSEARQSGIEILPPDINASFTDFTPDGDNRIRFGLLAIKNVGEAITGAVIAERAKSGPFKDFRDVLLRVDHKDLNKKSLESFAKSGVFDSLDVERKKILENIDDILKFVGVVRRGGSAPQHGSLFGGSAPGVTLSLQLKDAPLATSQEKLAWEKELLGFYLSDHPLKQFKEKIVAARARTIEELRAIKNERIKYRTAGVISKIHKIVTKSGHPMAFVTIEDLGPQPIEIIVFNNILTQTNAVWVENNVILVEGRMSLRDNDPKMICERAKILEA